MASRSCAIAVLLVQLIGCAATPRPPVFSTAGHLTDSQPAGEVDASIPPPVTQTPFIPAPKPRAKAPTFTVVVHDVPVKELLQALARDSGQNMDIHPGLQGTVSINAIDETLPAILDRIARQVNMRTRIEAGTIIVTPDTPYLHTYKVDYVNMTRDTTSTIAVSGQIDQAKARGTGASEGGSSQTQVTTTSHNNFWEVLAQNIEGILQASRALAQSATQRQAQAEAARLAREERIAQVEAVARAGQSAKDLYAHVFAADAKAHSKEIKQDIMVNPVAGTVAVMASEREHHLIQQYLESIQLASSRQVLIECTIAEVRLSQAYQAGVDWQKLVRGGEGFQFRQELLGNALGGAPRMVIGYGSPASDIALSIRLLEQFGKTRVLSSPKIMALNNQTALLKVVDNVVYFTVESSVSQNQTQTLQSVSTTANTVAVGVVLSLTPQIDANGHVTLTVRPTISRIARFVDDPNPLLKVNAQGVPLPNPIENKVPEIQVREMESVLQLVSQQTAVLGGLIQDNLRRDRDQVPLAGSLPKVGDLFAFRDEAVDKTELVIFLRPTVVTTASLDTPALRHLKRLLPESSSGAIQ
ncbi:MAG TPA: secretin N-terminal domain-containing protein [Burkholderiales bacterium]|nr:secretin N-terminal domain-containing protein [Burkholderiales bacterium]